MIVRRGLDVIRLVRELGPLLAVLLTYDVLLTLLYIVVGWKWVAIADLPLPLLGSAIVLVVTLRNNAAYTRWWEARALWGAVTNNSRSFCRAVTTLVPDEALRTRLVRMQAAYAVSLRQHLLRTPAWDGLATLLPASTIEPLLNLANVPFGIQAAIARDLAAAACAGTLDTVGLARLDATLGAIADAQGGLERIKNTPLTRQYNHFPMIFTRIYCVMLPIALVGELGVLTPIGSTLIGFMFLALDRIGRDLEDPMEGSIHDIPMAAIVRTIERDLLQTIGAPDVPEAAAPVAGILW